MKKNGLILVLLCFIFLLFQNIFSEEQENEEKIGYTYYENMAVAYRYDFSILNTGGNIFVDSDNILHVINPKGSFEFDSTGKILKHKNELEQIPLRIDPDNNIFLRDKNSIKKISNLGKLLYAIDIMPGEEFIYLDKDEKFYSITERDKFDENTTIEKDNLSKEIADIELEIAKIKIHDDSYFRDYDYQQKLYDDNKLRMRDLDWELLKLNDGYEHLWKTNIFLTSNPNQQAEINNRLAVLYDEIKRKKEDMFNYQKDQYDIEVRKKDMEKRIIAKENELLQKEIEIKQKIKEIEKEIQKDHTQKYIIKVMDSNEQIVKRIPIPYSNRAIPLWECINIVADNEGNFYGIYKDRIYVYDPLGTAICSFGKYGTHPGEIIKATQIAVDAKKSIYVVDANNLCINKFVVK